LAATSAAVAAFAAAMAACSAAANAAARPVRTCVFIIFSGSGCPADRAARAARIAGAATSWFLHGCGGLSNGPQCHSAGDPALPELLVLSLLPSGVVMSDNASLTRPTVEVEVRIRFGKFESTSTCQLVGAGLETPSPDCLLDREFCDVPKRTCEVDEGFSLDHALCKSACSAYFRRC